MPNSDDQYIAQLSRGAWIDQVADRFDAAWQSGGGLPQIVDFLSDSAGPLRRELLRELVAVDREYRTKRGLSKSWEEYVAEFPELEIDEPTDRRLIDTTEARRPSPELSPPGRADGKVVEPKANGQAGDDRPADPLQIGKYRVLKRLGGGGQATAYLVFDPDLSKSVVLKLSHEEALTGEEDELRREARVLADFDHPHLVRVLHYDLFDGRPYLVMEHVAGQNLAQWAGGARPPQLDAVRLVARIARGLAAAHRRGVVHRDLKPANVLIDEQGEPRIIDFGLAWHRHGWDEAGDNDSTIAGTVAYMPPEQARGELDRVGPRSDIFGLGGILYFLLTGQSLFMQPGERDFQRVLARARKCDFDGNLLARTGVSSEVVRICLRALAADPQARYATADELADDLATVVTGGQATRRLVMGGALAALAATSLAIYFGTRRRALPPVAGPVLALRVWRDGESLNSWLGAVPLLGGRDELQIRWKLPEGLDAELFSINGQGQISALSKQSPATGFEQAFPAADARSQLTGVSGTEGFLLCSYGSGRKMPRLPWDERKPWPALSAGTALRMTPAGVETLQRTRDLGPVRKGDDPDEVIRHRLEALRQELAKDHHYFEAIVFAHE